MRDRRGEVAGRAIAQPRRLGDDLVGGRIEVVGELDLGHRAQAVGAHADGDADDAAFGDRRVEHARVAVLGLQAFGAAEHAAEVADVLAEDDDVVVALEHHVHRRAQRLDHRHRAARAAGCRAAPLRRAGVIAQPRQIRPALALPPQVLAACPCRRPRTSSPALGDVAVGERAVALGLLLRGDHLGLEFACAVAACSLLATRRRCAIRCCFSRAIGSPSGKCCQSSAGRYLDGSSEVECAPAR